MLRWTDPNIGDSIVDVVLSISEQTKKLFSDKVALVSYSSIKPSIKTLDGINSKLDDIEIYINKMDNYPGTYLKAMTKAFRYYTRSLQGDKIPYDELLMAIQELPAKLISEDKARVLRERVDKGLTDYGYKGSTQEKIDSWLGATRIEPEQVTKTAEIFLKVAKKATLERICDLPKQDGIDAVKSIKEVFWSGYSAYTGGYRGNLTFNIDRPWSEPTFAQVLTHEAYPGHQTFYCKWDYLYQNGKLPLEASYYMVNSPTNALFEGGPEMALHFLGWDDENDKSSEITKDAKKRYALARDLMDMQRIAQTNACYLTNLGQTDKKGSLDYMKRVGFMNEIESENSYRFFTHPVQKTYYPSYYHGRWMIGKSYEMIPVDKRSEYFKILYDTPHTTSTFIEAIKTFTGKEFDPFKD